MSRLEPFAGMCDVQLEHIRTVKHSADLESSDISQKHLVAYLAGPAVCDFERPEINTIFGMNVIDPAQTEWALPVVFAP